MKRTHDKYGRGSAAANGIGFVDLEPGDTFDGLEARLRAIKDSVFECRRLGLRASVGSMRNANELAKHLAKGELEEVHKFAAKNLGVLFSRAGVGIRHLDKKADPKARWVVTYVRVFAWFVFDGDRKLATITLKQNHGQHNFYSVEALEINKDAESERTPRGAISEDLNSAPLQNLASQLANKITYYVGDVKRTRPAFVADEEPFSVEHAAGKILTMGGAENMKRTDLTVIILTGNEELHIGRCLEKLRDLNPLQVLVVESQKGDRTHEKAIEVARQLQWQVKVEGVGLEEKGAIPMYTYTSNLYLIWHDWPGNQAEQFNWALDHVEIKGSWVLRLDADEYLYPETIEELKKLVTDGGLPTDVTSLSLSLSRRIFGGDIRHGHHDIELVRAFKKGYGRSIAAEMDEHIVTSEGKNYKLKGKFVDDSLLPFAEWQEKHRHYAKREARMAVEGRANKNKHLYYKLPPYFRAFAYFCIRYFLKLGFLDGLPGWRWHFWQGLWYRCLVDREIGRLRKQKRF